MSILARDVNQVRDAAAIAKKLSPPMRAVLSAPESDVSSIGMRVESVDKRLAVFGAKANTACALIVRDLMTALQYRDGTPYHFLTEQGALVRRVLVEGIDKVLAEANQPMRTQPEQQHQASDTSSARVARDHSFLSGRSEAFLVGGGGESTEYPSVDTVASALTDRAAPVGVISDRVKTVRRQRNKVARRSRRINRRK
jgi:hypothetical protein